MIVGIIKTKDVIFHPFLLIQMRGVKGYFKVLRRALSHKPYTFINMIQSSRLWVRSLQHHSKPLELTSH